MRSLRWLESQRSAPVDILDMFIAPRTFQSCLYCCLRCLPRQTSNDGSELNLVAAEANTQQKQTPRKTNRNPETLKTP